MKKTNNALYNAAISLLQEAVDKSLIVQISFYSPEGTTYKNEIYSIYSGVSGQRQAKIQNYDFLGDKANPKKEPPFFPKDFFHIVRHNTFTNKEDEGTEGAILGVLKVGSAKNISIISFDYHTKIKLDNLEIIIQQ